MKKLTAFFTLAIFLCSAVIIPSKETSPASSIDFSKITIEQLIKLTPSQIKEVTGESLNFKEKLVLNLMQKDLKRSVKKNILDKSSTVNFQQYLEDGVRKFDFGGFLMGLLLGLIGVALAHIFSPSKNFRRSSWQGFGVWIIILIALGVLASV